MLYLCFLKVLRALRYIDADNMVELKGKVACEIHHQELLITELMLDNRFEALEPAEVAAMLSATTCQYKKSKNGGGASGGDRPSLKANLEKVIFISFFSFLNLFSFAPMYWKYMIESTWRIANAACKCVKLAKS